MKATKNIQEDIKYDVLLYHDNGHDVTLNNVDEKSLKFIRNNLGNNVIYSQKNISVNLSKFSIAQVDSKDIRENKHG